MPHLYKIGHTFKSPLQRAADLSGKTNIPKPFEVVYYGGLNNPHYFEQELHEIYDEFRVNKSREFFNLSYDDLFWLCNHIKKMADHVCEFDFFNMVEYEIMYKG